MREPKLIPVSYARNPSTKHSYIHSHTDTPCDHVHIAAREAMRRKVLFLELHIQVLSCRVSSINI